MKRLIVIFVLLYVLAPTSTQAQTSTPTPCDLSSILKEVGGFKGTRDNTKDLTNLTKLQTDIGSAIAACNGMKWGSNGAKVIGPIDLPTGTYKAAITSSSVLTADIKTISGTCTADSAVPGYLFMVMNTDSTQRTDETTIESQDCRLIIDVGDVLKPWSLTIEPLQ